MGWYIVRYDCTLCHYATICCCAGIVIWRLLRSTVLCNSGDVAVILLFPILVVFCYTNCWVNLIYLPLIIHHFIDVGIGDAISVLPVATDDDWPFDIHLFIYRLFWFIVTDYLNGIAVIWWKVFHYIDHYLFWYSDWWTGSVLCILLWPFIEPCYDCSSCCWYWPLITLFCIHCDTYGDGRPLLSHLIPLFFWPVVWAVWWFFLVFCWWLLFYEWWSQYSTVPGGTYICSDVIWWWYCYSAFLYIRYSVEWFLRWFLHYCCDGSVDDDSGIGISVHHSDIWSVDGNLIHVIRYSVRCGGIVHCLMRWPLLCYVALVIPHRCDRWGIWYSVITLCWCQVLHFLMRWPIRVLVFPRYLTFYLLMPGEYYIVGIHCRPVCIWWIFCICLLSWSCAFGVCSYCSVDLEIVVPFLHAECDIVTIRSLVVPLSPLIIPLEYDLLEDGIHLLHCWYCCWVWYYLEIRCSRYGALFCSSSFSFYGDATISRLRWLRYLHSIAEAGALLEVFSVRVTVHCAVCDRWYVVTTFVDRCIRFCLRLLSCSFTGILCILVRIRSHSFTVMEYCWLFWCCYSLLWRVSFVRYVVTITTSDYGDWHCCDIVVLYLADWWECVTMAPFWPTVTPYDWPGIHYIPSTLQ